MVVRPEPPLGTDSPDELAEHVSRFRGDWLVYLRSLTGYTAEVEERLQLEKDKSTSSIPTRLSALCSKWSYRIPEETLR